MKMKNVLWILPIICLSLFSCFDDKGNYDYRELDEIEITNIPDEIAVLANAENIVVSPKVISKQEGEIKADHPNYTFTYYYNKIVTGDDGYNHCTVLDSSFTKDLNILAKMPAEKYSCWFEVMDKRTELITRKTFSLNVASTITEGWMVLCNEGVEKSVRLDMIGVISAEREVVTHDIVSGLPLVHNALSIAFDPKFLDSDGADISLLSEEGGYRLDPTDFMTGPEYSMNYLFGDQTVHHIPVNFYKAYNYPVVIDSEGDIYMHGPSYGAVYGMPFNVLKAGTLPTFKVSKYLGNLSGIPGLLIYNTTEKRFMMWYAFSSEIMMELPAPDPKLFDWNIGKEMVYMAGTENNYGIYALMKDAQNRYSLCGIEATLYSYPPKYKQALYQDGDGAGIQATRLSEAKLFAFHPKLPYLFYAVENEVWQYDYSTRQSRRMIELDKQETVTMIKFNLFTGNYFNIEKPDEYFDIQYRLIVGSTDKNIDGENNGKLRFYNVPELNGALVQYGKTYEGFAEIKDVVYREAE